MTKRVTLADIAQESGVSVATVSMVLRERAGAIPPETQRRIRDSARTLGYSPRTPRPTRARAVDTLGVIIKGKDEQPMRDNPFYSGILAGIEDTCRRNHINLFYSAIPVDSDNCPTEYPRLLSNNTINGLMVVGVWVTDRLQRMLGELGAPVVLVDGYAASPDYDAVVSDNRDGARQAVAHLHANGHRHIAMAIGESGGYPSIRERRYGYIEALGECGLSVSYIADSAHAPEQLRAEVERLLLAHPEITALFGSNDRMTLEAARAARAVGRRIPDDLSLVGFDDVELAQHAWPPLTTLHVDTFAMGRMAVNLMLHRLEFPDAALVTAIMRPRLIKRQSVAPIAPPEMVAAPSEQPTYHGAADH
jgi:LacI family transcriptional regulator